MLPLGHRSVVDTHHAIGHAGLSNAREQLVGGQQSAFRPHDALGSIETKQRGAMFAERVSGHGEVAGGGEQPNLVK